MFKESLSRYLRMYFAVALLLLVIDWGLGVGRFYFSPLIVPFVFLNFPFSLAFLFLENQPTGWWHSFFGPLVNDEIGQFASFFLMVVLQAALITGLFLRFKRYRIQNLNSATTE